MRVRRLTWKKKTVAFWQENICKVDGGYLWELLGCHSDSGIPDGADWVVYVGRGVVTTYAAARAEIDKRVKGDG